MGKKIDAATVKVGGVISDGNGGFFTKGEKIEGLAEATRADLKAKGLID